ncbi:hypothetical protein [Streptomyces sp. NPDC003877]
MPKFPFVSASRTQTYQGEIEAPTAEDAVIAVDDAMTKSGIECRQVHIDGQAHIPSLTRSVRDKRS